MHESVCRVVGGGCRALLVRSLRSLRIASRGLVGVGRRVWVVHEVSLGAIASGILLLLGRLRVSGLSALALRLEDRVGEGGGSRRVGAGVRNEFVVIVPEIQVQAVGVVVIHGGRGCQCNRQTLVEGLEVVML
jgi:hypothetical protein